MEMNDTSKILNYFTCAQVLELLKLLLKENEYYMFLSNKEFKSENLSNETFIIEKMSIVTLFDIIKKYNSTLYNNLLNEMINTLY